MDQSDIIGPDHVPMQGSEVILLYFGLLIGLAALGALVIVLVWRTRRNRRDPQTSRTRRPLLPAVFACTAFVALALTWTAWPRDFEVPEFPALPRLFPENTFFYKAVDDLAVSTDSDKAIAAMGDRPLVAATGSSLIVGRTRGMPFNFVDENTPMQRIELTYSGGPTEYPISDPAYVQSMPLYFGDNHYVGIDLDNRVMWEVANLRRWFWIWQGGSGALWDLDSVEFPDGGTTAAGVPMFPMAFTYEEVAAGSIDHVLALSMPNVRVKDYQWPARNSDGPDTNPDAPAMGAWFRLKADADLSQLGPQARVVAEALQTYGAVLMDTGGSVAFMGGLDARWDDDDLKSLGKLTTEDLEVVESSSLMVDESSMEVSD